jgi:nucleoside 2-deoxyribosyltransferase
MKIYFCGSIRGGRELAHAYALIIGMLSEYGMVLTEHVGSDEVIQTKDRELSDREIHDRDLGWIVESDVLVAEVTVPSLGVGYEIGRALEMGKPILCLFNVRSGKPLSAMVAGSEKLLVKRYEETADIEAILEEYFTLHAPRRTS